MALTGLCNKNSTSYSGACCSNQCMAWDVPQLISTEKKRNHKYSILVLNRPLIQDSNFLVNFWNNAELRVTVDGGTRQWDSFLTKLPADVLKKIKLPDIVTGDFDSISEEIFEKYRKKGCEMVHTPDQNYTDFTKALMEVDVYCAQNKLEPNHIIAFGQSSGRLDQILGNIQTLHLVKEKSLLPNGMKVYLISDDAISWLLYPGEHIIHVPEETRKHKRAWCSLVPVGEPCERVTTRGLKWDLNDQPLKFGDLVSTSNTFAGPHSVMVNCSHTLLWSMRVPSLLDK